MRIIKTVHPFRKIRDQLGLTTVEFGSIVGLRPNSITSIETFLSHAGMLAVEGVAEAFNLDFDELWLKIREADKKANEEFKKLAEEKYKEALKNGHVIKL